MKKFLLICTVVLCGASAWAQAPHPFVGQWRVSWGGEDGRMRPTEAELDITPTGGHWRTIVSNPRTIRASPCAIREAPIDIQSVSERSIEFIIRYSSVLTGCDDSRVRLRMDDANRVMGRRGPAALTLERR